MTQVWVELRFSGHRCYGFRYGLKPSNPYSLPTLTHGLWFFSWLLYVFFFLVFHDTLCHPSLNTTTTHIHTPCTPTPAALACQHAHALTHPPSHTHRPPPRALACPCNTCPCTPTQV